MFVTKVLLLRRPWLIGLIAWLVASETHSGWAFCQIWLEVY